MIIKRDDIINASWYFPIDYDDFLEVVNNSSKRFYAFNGKVFDKQKKYKKLDYKKAICEIEETDGDGFNYTLNTIIISGFPGVGKSYFVKTHQDILVLDSRSSELSWLKDEQGKNTILKNPQFPQQYIDHIKENLGSFDIILVSSHDTIRKALEDNNIEYFLAYPNKALKDEYMNRYIHRGNDYNFIKVVETNWDKWISDIEKEKFPFLIQLGCRQYLSDLFEDTPICKTYHELCSVKKTNADEYPTLCYECNSKAGLEKMVLI